MQSVSYVQGAIPIVKFGDLVFRLTLEYRIRLSDTVEISPVCPRGVCILQQDPVVSADWVAPRSGQEQGAGGEKRQGERRIEYSDRQMGFNTGEPVRADVPAAGDRNCGCGFPAGQGPGGAPRTGPTPAT